MHIYPVYKLWNINALKAKGCIITDDQGTEYLDFYGGHAVISIGHSHPVYVKALCDQLQHIGFYSNAIVNPLQEALAGALGRVSGYPEYSLFLCNSGAEANENALKLASFSTGRNRVLAFRNAFHGRTSGAVALTDNPSIRAPFNQCHQADFICLDDIQALESALPGTIIAAYHRGIRSRGYPESLGYFLHPEGTVHRVTIRTDNGRNPVRIGRTGKFFAHQHAGIQADIITMAKGMGNGFPIGGLLISPHIKAVPGQLGTTFGGNHLACAAALAVLQVMQEERLMDNAREIGSYMIGALQTITAGAAQIRGRGLMIGIETDPEMLKDRNLREDLLWKGKIFTGASGPGILRLLPPLCITKEQADKLLTFLELWYTSHP